MDQTQKLNAPIRKHIFLIVAGILLCWLQLLALIGRFLKRSVT